MNSEISEQLKVLEKEVTFHKEESGKLKAEVDRLLGVLRELESELTEKDNAISELERYYYAAPTQYSFVNLHLHNFYITNNFYICLIKSVFSNTVFITLFNGL